MKDFWDWLASGAGSVLLALLAGAGGSALLEVLWRPWRDRRRAASLLTAEIMMNTQLLLLQAHARQHNPRGVPADFRMSTIAWDAATNLVSELPQTLLRKIVILYGQYDAINRNVAAFGVALDDYKAATAGTGAARDAETMVIRILDVFNTGLDATLKRGQEVLPEIAAVGSIEDTDSEKAQIRNYSDIAAEHMAMRQQHLEALGAAPPKPQAEP